jgi:hypothetical protein
MRNYPGRDSGGAGESGSALLLTLIALALLSLLGFFVVLDANTGVKISDNFETQIQATYAALAGLNHARVLVRGLAYNDLLRGPDGAYDNSTSYLAQARGFEFRNPISLMAAHSLDISNPGTIFLGVPDDGLISAGFYGISSGTLLIPASGIALESPNPYGAGHIVTSRYFVKVTDNNGEGSEVSGDSNDNPFLDGDGIVIVRSVGVSRTFSEEIGAIRRLNSISVFEARFKRPSTFDAGPALVVLGTDVSASFDGTFDISGALSSGIGTIDTDITDAHHPDQVILGAVGGKGLITGGGLPIPSIQDISGSIQSDRDRALLLNPGFLWDFIQTKAPQFADNYFNGDQNWSNGSVPNLGQYDISRPWNAPGQDPKITVVHGNLNVTGGFSGGGLLIVTGTFSYTGTCGYNGLVLVIGSGSLSADGSGQGIQGAVILASLVNGGGVTVFGVPAISVKGSSRFLSNRDAVQMALRLLPVSQVSFREIAGVDP